MKRTIILVAIALLTLIGVQLYWIQNAYALRQNQIREHVNQILAKTAKLTVEASTCFELFGKALVKSHEGIYFAKQGWEGKETFVPLVGRGPDSVKMYFIDDGDTNLYHSNSIKFLQPISIEFVMKCRYLDEGSITATGPQMQKSEYDFLNYRGYKAKMDGEAPIAARIKLHFLDSCLHSLMLSPNLASDYHYGIIRNDNDSAEFVSPKSDIAELKRSPMFAALINDKYFSHPYRLALYFDSGNALALSALWGSLLISAIVILLLCYAFWYFVKTILAQKKLSEMKTDFINNMTHEFKTPITNISLAVENIYETGRLNGHTPLLKIIGEENNRLRENVERILQIAYLDNKEIHLQVNKININSLAARIASNMEYSQCPEKPDIRQHLNAENPYILADKTHITNLIYNLLDNALKYCQDKPIVDISTSNVANGVMISIEDNGIGMDHETQKRAFDQFYRAHTGNIHDIKGFGLGLSYVKNIVSLHHGAINLDSEPGRGSRFEIFLPFHPSGQPVMI